MHYFKIAGFLAVSGLGIGAVLFEFANLATPVTFASLESVTNKGHTVFNQVQLLSGVDKDVWLMRQSHRGLTPDKQNWDRLAIIIDKSTTPTSTLSRVT